MRPRAVLRILANSKNQEFDAQEFAVELKDYLKAYPGRLNHASKELIAAIDSGKSFPACGADDSQANSLVKAALAVAAFQGRDDWALRAEDVMRAHQNNEIAIKFGMGAAHIVHRILRGSSIRDALAWAVSPDSPLDAEVKASAKTAAEFGTNHTCQEAAAAFGSSCALPAAFRVCIHLLSKDLPFEEAVRQNILEGLSRSRDAMRRVHTHTHTHTYTHTHVHTHTYRSERRVLKMQDMVSSRAEGHTVA